MVSKLAAVAIALALGACAPTAEIIREPFQVNVPVAVAPDVPASLLAPMLLIVPSWIDPTDPEATSALGAEGERQLKALIAIHRSRIEAWEAWATALQDQ